jgi:uncharacterized protein YdeI (YjbR/CyaY-like superfamily)
MSAFSAGMRTPDNVVFFESAAELRAWFEANHQTAPELWVGFHRKGCGRAAFAARDEARSRIYAYENRAMGLSEELEKTFRKRRAAWAFFESQAPWYRRTAAHWVMSAKREATRESRLKTLIEDSSAGRRLGHLNR